MWRGGTKVGCRFPSPEGRGDQGVRTKRGNDGRNDGRTEFPPPPRGGGPKGGGPKGGTMEGTGGGGNGGGGRWPPLPEGGGGRRGARTKRGNDGRNDGRTEFPLSRRERGSKGGGPRGGTMDGTMDGTGFPPPRGGGG